MTYRAIQEAQPSRKKSRVSIGDPRIVDDQPDTVSLSDSDAKGVRRAKVEKLQLNREHLPEVQVIPVPEDSFPIEIEKQLRLPALAVMAQDQVNQLRQELVSGQPAKGTPIETVQQGEKNHPHIFGASYSHTNIRLEQGMQHPYPALDSTAAYLNKKGIRAYNLVRVGEYGYSNAPMASFGFKFCDALVLRDPNQNRSRALAHILSDADPRPYLDNIIQLFGTSDLEAIAIKAGYQRHKLIQVCDELGIRILDTYDIPMRNDYQTYPRDVIVMPASATVLVNIDELGLLTIEF